MSNIDLPDVIKSITPVDDFEPSGEDIRIELPPYCLHPSDDCATYAQVFQQIKDAIVEQAEDEDEDEDAKETDDVPITFTERVSQRLSKFITPIPMLSEKPTVFVRITYPVRTKAMFRVVFRPDAGQLNIAMLHIAHATAYKLMYALEDGDTEAELIPGMFNRQFTQGPYGIWGHCIEDLIYNGSCQLNIFQNSLVCKLSCDS